MLLHFSTFTPVAIAFCGDSKVIFLDVSLFNCLYEYTMLGSRSLKTMLKTNSNEQQSGADLRDGSICTTVYMECNQTVSRESMYCTDYTLYG